MLGADAWRYLQPKEKQKGHRFDPCVITIHSKIEHTIQFSNYCANETAMTQKEA